MAQQAYPTVPIAATVWNAGANVTVQWKLNASGEKAALAVDLFKGDPAHQTLVKKLGTGALGKTSLKATLPAKLDSDWYSVRIGDSYSHYFMIKGTGPVPTGSPPTAAPTVLPTASSAANSTTTPTGTQSIASPTQSTSSASYLSTAPMAVIAGAVVAAALALF
ncbi:hypothetical protein BG011_007773 [Mortierella polycephala]|uniref:Uncharacterized protein n=1 Tax=Mortierella polycephala TaxID=41804 RepID=A0A9P6QB66_9FUNG|nr:hypothetical protein BG011_007773 [Mortierella polycephala]